MRRVAISVLVVVGVLLIPATALSHIERNSYWPNAAPDASVHPAAGGKVPKPRSLTSAAHRHKGTHVRVVCKPKSLKSAYQSIRTARKRGVRIRPSVPAARISAKQARRLKKLNRYFFKKCKYRNIQKAVFRSRNNDRIVVMPGLYTEDPSRKKLKNDPRCAQYRVKSDKGANAASYEYQVKCPNDQSLIFVGGRSLSGKKPPDPPLQNRHGIPDAGPCKRCNLQIEGSGASPDDVRIDAAKDPRRSQLRKQGTPVKDVDLKADRADGFVIRNMTLAHAAEHALYVHEADGYLISKVKVLYNGEYGTLTFASDHGMTSDCEAAGNGDSGVYPGGAVDTGEQRIEAKPRLNQAITRCDVHHNTLGYSGTMGNATHVYGNNFYDNSTAIATDSFFAGGHPGYPQDSALFENNKIYGNNFNSYVKGSDVVPRVPVPVGTGLLIAGGNNNTVRGNRIWDNWRRGAMLIAVPDAVSDHTGYGTTSNRNKFYGNVMGVGPHSGSAPNGVDFWWDQYPGNTDNCWYSNGKATTDPIAPFMPSSCKNTSPGTFYSTRAQELGGCAAALEFGSQTRTGSGKAPEYDERQCTWFQSPPKPGSSSRPTLPAVPKAKAASFARTARDVCHLTRSTTPSCDAFFRQGK
ncbi:MAG TPA: right-handed parallel beta-helix repeat-containing protein [Thermoleophilaceae bacterium]|jgi:hypothetical protein|nr:right-handed parallel beta-helix repeat-containing protein [Thermoleophilaceae bacterium]